MLEENWDLRIQLFDQENYQGNYLELGPGTIWTFGEIKKSDGLGNWNDCIKSLAIIKDGVKIPDGDRGIVSVRLYRDVHFQGPSLHIVSNYSSFNVIGYDFNDHITAVKFPPYSVTPELFLEGCGAWENVDCGIYHQ